MSMMKTKIDLQGEYEEVYRKAALFYALDNLLYIDVNNSALLEVKDILANAQSEGKSVKDVLGNDIPATLREIEKGFAPISIPKKIYHYHVIAISLTGIIKSISSISKIESSINYADEYFKFLIMFLSGLLLCFSLRVFFKRKFHILNKSLNKYLIGVYILYFATIFTVLDFNMPKSNIVITNTSFWVIFGINYFMFFVYTVFTVKQKIKKEGYTRNEESEERVFRLYDEFNAQTNELRVINRKIPLSDYQMAQKIITNRKLGNTLSLLFSLMAFSGLSYLIIFQTQNGSSRTIIVSIIVLIGLLLLNLLLFSGKRIDLKYAYLLKKRNLSIFEKGIWTERFDIDK